MPQVAGQLFSYYPAFLLPWASPPEVPFSQQTETKHGSQIPGNEGRKRKLLEGPAFLAFVRAKFKNEPVSGGDGAGRLNHWSGCRGAASPRAPEQQSIVRRNHRCPHILTNGDTRQSHRLNGKPKLH